MNVMNENPFLHRAIAAVAVALAVALAFGLAACASPEGSKAGGPSGPVVLRMATVNANLYFTPQVNYLVHRVEELSGGELRIDMVYKVGGFGPDSEQQMVRGVAAGTFDLGFVGTRVFDMLGVTSFQALTAPMLVDSYPLEQAVIQSNIPRRMMAGLHTVHVTGLGVLADGLRKPIAVGKPLLSPKDWAGITFAAYRSEGQAEAIRALGARESNVFGPPLDEALLSGSVQGFEKNLLTYQKNEMESETPYVTANVNLWPQMLAVIGNPGRVGRLAPQQRGWLHRAAAEAAARSTGLVDGDAGLLANLCASGVRFADASRADIAALRKAFAPVYAHLEQHAPTNGFVAEIRRLKEQMPSGDPLVIPHGCTGPAPKPTQSTGSSPPKTTAVTPLDGAWQVTFTRDELLRDTTDPNEDNPANYGRLTLVFHRGDFHGTNADGSTWVGTYVVAGKEITFHVTAPIAGTIFRFTWSVYRDMLTLTKRGSGEHPTPMVVKPWTRVSN
jgi:TRAP-type C4-dicarboxylate transport system substrate-binding protein